MIINSMNERRECIKAEVDKAIDSKKNKQISR